MDENNITKLDAGDNERSKYKVKAIQDSAVYSKESKLGYLPEFYYLVSWKGYLVKENIWKPALAIQHLRKLISSFYKDYLIKPIVTSKAIDTILLMAKPNIRPMTLKQK